LLCPGPRWGSSQRSPRPCSWIKGRKGYGKGGKGEEGRGREGRDRIGRGRREGREEPSKQKDWLYGARWRERGRRERM